MNKPQQYSVGSICAPNKYGLMDHAVALYEYGSDLDSSKSYLDPLDSNNFVYVPVNTHCRRASHWQIWVVWDNSLFSFLSALVARFRRAKLVYFLHEPGGLEQKLAKGDGLLYSLSARAAEIVMAFLSHRVISAHPKNRKHVDLICPLLYSERKSSEIDKKRRIIGFLGAVRSSRTPALFEEVCSFLLKMGYEVRFFPSAEFGQKSSEKLRFLDECFCVWNVYSVPHNQSGVSGDCIMSQTCVVHSKYEAYMKVLASLSLSIAVDLESSPAEIAKSIEAAYKSGCPKNSLEVQQLEENDSVRSAFGGAVAFRKSWLPMLSQLTQD